METGFTISGGSYGPICLSVCQFVRLFVCLSVWFCFWSCNFCCILFFSVCSFGRPIFKKLKLYTKPNMFPKQMYKMVKNMIAIELFIMYKISIGNQLIFVKLKHINVQFQFLDFLHKVAMDDKLQGTRRIRSEQQNNIYSSFNDFTIDVFFFFFKHRFWL